MKVLLLHAWPLDESMWAPQRPLLEEAGLELVAPRLYGRGASIDAWAAQLLDEVEGPVVAVGASMGGYTGLALARRAPERIVGLALVGSRADADSEDRRGTRDALIAELRAGRLPPGVESDVPTHDLAVAQEAIRDRPDSSAIVASFGGPLLVCVGDADEVVSVDEARAIADAAIRGTLVTFPGAGHLLSVEQPERFGEALLDFLEQWRT